MVDAPGETSPIAAPTGLAVAPGDTKNTVSWDAVTGATAYNLYFRTTTGVDKTNGTKLAGVTSPYNHTGLTNTTTYYYVVTAEDDNTESDESSQASGTPTASPTISAPTLFSAVAGDQKITLNWAPVSGAVGYNVYRGLTTGVTQGTGTLIASVTSPYVDTPLDNGTTYFYVVTAFNATEESADSSEVSATPRAATEGQAVALDYVTPIANVPLNAKAYDVEGWITYRRQASDSSVTLILQSSGEDVFDESIGPITLPSTQSVPVYGGTYYYGQSIYYGISFSRRLTRKKFDARALSNSLQVRIQSDDVNPLSIVEIAFRFRAAST